MLRWRYAAVVRIEAFEHAPGGGEAEHVVDQEPREGRGHVQAALRGLLRSLLAPEGAVAVKLHVPHCSRVRFREGPHDGYLE